MEGIQQSPFKWPVVKRMVHEFGGDESRLVKNRGVFESVHNFV